MRLSAVTDVPKDASEFEESKRFGPVQFRRYEWEQTYTTAEYLDLLLTYSNHRALPQEARGNLLAAIGNLIDHDYSGRVTKRYLTQLAIAYRTH